MWYLFKDYAETPSHIEMMIFGASMVASYLVASLSCKSRNMSGFQVPAFATASGLMVAALCGGIKFTFVSTLLISVFVAWLMVRRAHAYGW